ncbi:MAG: helix-turn-helix transcriptional regulator [Candidatus Eremiobacteraeota bacterium]|nr:helix-turn-helix transcriptional regulator [Candidatus Eremiobacteraeota bacterium]MBV8355443.1 helix-turn-helix transcriptional regulator [Candidatus Eremiobacteraeota bacterium]
MVAAREVFERHGTRGTTTREIADRAGVNEATIFRHFGNKVALLDAMREYSCNAMGMGQLFNSMTGDLDTDLRLLCTGLYRGILANQAIIRIGLAEEQTDPDQLETSFRGPQRIHEGLVTYLRSQADKGAIRGDAQELAGILMGTMFALAVKTNRFQWGSKPEATIATFVDVFLNGVRTRN